MVSPAFSQQAPPVASSAPANYAAFASQHRKPERVYPEQIIGQYAIGERIGHGSFGKVKKGRHIPTGETVAIKILNLECLKASKMYEKINREIEILKLFSHPNICRLYEVIYTSTDIYLIMEYVGCGELYDYIVKCGTVPENEARYIFQQIICAIEYCHHFRVAHRDLKPENILIGQGLQVKVIDFGLSNLMQDGKFLTTSCGSPNYAAPEVISGKLYIGPEADVWSCGVILYTLLCGSLPFNEHSVQDLFDKIRKGIYPPPENISDGPRELIKNILLVDSLVRLTIPQIRDCAWFNEKLPARLMYSKSTFRACDDRIFSTVAGETAQRLGMDVRELREEVERRSGCGYVAYQILLDARRRREIAAEAHELGVLNSKYARPTAGGIIPEMDETGHTDSNNNNSNNNTNRAAHPQQCHPHPHSLPPSYVNRDEMNRGGGGVGTSSKNDNNNNTHSRAAAAAAAASTHVHDDIVSSFNRFSHALKATEHELNMGMMLTQSPAMEKILELANAVDYKDAYNSSCFLPASAHEANKMSSLCRSAPRGGGVLAGSPFYLSPPAPPSPTPMSERYAATRTASRMSDTGALSASVESATTTASAAQPSSSLQNRSFCMTRHSVPCSGRYAVMPSLAMSDYPSQRRMWQSQHHHHHHYHHQHHHSHNYQHSCYSPNHYVLMEPYSLTLSAADYPLPAACYLPLQPPPTSQPYPPSHRHTQRYPTREHSRASSSLTGGGGTSTPHVGSVAQKHTTFTREEESFLIHHNCGWRVGLMTDGDLDRTLMAICEVLRALQMQWKTASAFSLMARTTAETWPILCGGQTPHACAQPPMCEGNVLVHRDEDEGDTSASDECGERRGGRVRGVAVEENASAADMTGIGGVMHTDSTTHHVSRAIPVGRSIMNTAPSGSLDFAATADGDEAERDLADTARGGGGGGCVGGGGDNSHVVVDNRVRGMVGSSSGQAAKGRDGCDSTTYACSSTTGGCSSTCGEGCTVSLSKHRAMYSHAGLVDATRASKSSHGQDGCADSCAPALHDCDAHMHDRQHRGQQGRLDACVGPEEDRGRREEMMTARHCPAATPPLQRAIIHIHLFRVFERCDKGFIVDFSIAHNSLIEIELVLRLSDMLLQKIR